jgi:hypothetical protein
MSQKGKFYRLIDAAFLLFGCELFSNHDLAQPRW